MDFLNDHINVFGLIAALVILVLTIYESSSLIKEMRDSKSQGELIGNGHLIDGIGEFANNVPVGWIASFMCTIVWAFWYFFFGYPLNSFSQIGQYNEEVKAHNQKFEAKWKHLGQKELVDMGQGIFLVHCSQCHGITAEGLHGSAQNLVRWGKEEGIMDTIKHGSKGMDYLAGEMPAMELDEKDAKAIASYVMAEISSVKKTKNPQLIDKGKELFESMGCTGCHGNDGKGLQENQVFAADLTAYGTESFLRNILTHGKKGNIGHMPSFKYKNFSDLQVKALAEFVQSLKPLED